MKSSPSAALARIDPRLDKFRGVGPAFDPAWQRTWLNLESDSWRSLAVVPTGHLSSIDVVHGLAAIAWQQRGKSVIVADLRAIDISDLSAAQGELRRRVDEGHRILVATQSLDKNPTATTVVRWADMALVCVMLAEASRRQVRDTIREIGAQRCIGSILIRRSEL